MILVLAKTLIFGSKQLPEIRQKLAKIFPLQNRHGHIKSAVSVRPASDRTVIHPLDCSCGFRGFDVDDDAAVFGTSIILLTAYGA